MDNAGKTDGQYTQPAIPTAGTRLHHPSYRTKPAVKSTMLKTRPLPLTDDHLPRSACRGNPQHFSETMANTECIQESIIQNVYKTTTTDLDDKHLCTQTQSTVVPRVPTER